jgi:hypothetical protein
MEREIGFVVVEFNQASGQPSMSNLSEIETLEEALVTKIYQEAVTRKSGRGERYAIATLTIEDD